MCSGEFPIKRNLLFIFCIFLFAETTVFTIAHKNIGIVFDETTIVPYLRELVKERNIKTTPQFFTSFAKEIFYEPTEGPSIRPMQKLYRPLQVMTVSSKTLSFWIFQHQPIYPVLINGFLLGLAGGLLFLLFFFLTQSYLVSVGSGFLMMYSAPAINASWLALSGEHCLIPTLFCLSIFCYLKRWLIALFFILFLSPLYKEYAGLCSVIIFFAELLNRNRNWKLIVSLLPILFHSFYPAFFINLIFFKHWVILSTVKKTNVLSGSFNFHWNAINRFFLTIPPSLVFLGLLGIVAKLKDTKVPFYIFFSILIFFSFISIFLTHTPATRYFLGFLLVVITLSAFLIHRVVALWFIIGTLPFLPAFFGVEVYFIYTNGVLAAILLWHSKYLFHKCATKKYIKYILGLWMGIAFLDQALNLFAARNTFKDTYSKSTAIADTIAINTGEKPAAIFSSTLLVDDVKWYLSERHHKQFSERGYAFEKGVGKLHPHYYGTLDKLKNKIAFIKNNTNVYALDLKQNPESSLIALLNQTALPFKVLATFSTDLKYYFLDPFKNLVPSDYISYPGSPDLGENIHIIGGVFYRRIVSEIDLYKLNTTPP